MGTVTGAGTNDGISGLSSEQKLSSKGFGSGAKKDGRKEAAKQRSARKLAAERGPDVSRYLEKQQYANSLICSTFLLIFSMWSHRQWRSFSG